MSERPIRRRSRIAATTLTAAAVAAVGLTAPTAAYAIDAPAGYTNQGLWNNTIAPAVAAGTSIDLGDLVVTLKPGAKATDTRPIASVTTAPGALPAPAGYNVQGQEFYVMDNAYVVQSDVYARRDAKSAGRGLDGGAINYTDSDANPIVGVEALSRKPGFTQSGYVRYVLTLSSSEDAVRPHQAGVAFYDAILFWNKTTGELSVYNGAVKTATTTAVTATSTTQTSTTLTAAVAPNTATGTVEFKNGNTVLGTGTVTNGQASTGVSGLTADTEYTVTANYLGDTTHEASTGTVAFKTLAETTVPPADTEDTTIGVEVLPGVVAPEKGLTITAPIAAVTLTGGTRNDGQEWVATGQLAPVTVNDDRPSKAGTDWSLTGAATKFTSGANEIAASSLGWTPADATGTDGHGTKGAAATDLSQAKTLASGKTLATRDSTTSVGAVLKLTVPSTAVAGNYPAKLTLTLI